MRLKTVYIYKVTYSTEHANSYQLEQLFVVERDDMKAVVDAIPGTRRVQHIDRVGSAYMEDKS